MTFPHLRPKPIPMPKRWDGTNQAHRVLIVYVPPRIADEYLTAHKP